MLLSNILPFFGFELLATAPYVECSPLQQESETSKISDPPLSLLQYQQRKAQTQSPAFTKKTSSQQSSIDDIFALPQAQSPSTGAANLDLKSSLNKITGINDTTIYSLPIRISDLTELLEVASADLSTKDSEATTPFFRTNTTTWSLFVIAPEAPLQYSTIGSIISRYAVLAQGSGTDSPSLSWTRVGVVRGGYVPIADVMILPVYTTTAPNDISQIQSTAKAKETRPKKHNENPPLTSSPVEVMILSPESPTPSYAFLNPIAILNSIDPYQKHTLSSSSSSSSSSLTSRTLSLPPELTLPIIHTTFTLALRLWLNSHHQPVRTTLLVLRAIIYLSLMQIFLGALKSTLLHTFVLPLNNNLNPNLNTGTEAAFDEANGFDSGLLAIGGVGARVVMSFMARGEDGRLVGLGREVWRAVLVELGGVFGGEGGGGEDGGRGEAYALEGFIQRRGRRFARFEVEVFPWRL